MDFPTDWQMADGPVPSAPAGMRWVHHPFEIGHLVLDAKLPPAPARQRFFAWGGWKVIGLLLVMLAWGLFAVMVSSY
jgi:hypothetical protein